MKFLSEDGCDYVNIVKSVITEDSLCLLTFTEDVGVGNLVILHKTQSEGLANFILGCLDEDRGYQSERFYSLLDESDYVNVSKSVLSNKDSFYINSFEGYVSQSNTVILQDDEAEKLARFILEELSKE